MMRWQKVESIMKRQYEFPDEPAVFQRVLEHFENTRVSHWEERISRYSSATQDEQRASIKSPQLPSASPKNGSKVGAEPVARKVAATK